MNIPEETLASGITLSVAGVNENNIYLKIQMGELPKNTIIKVVCGRYERKHKIMLADLMYHYLNFETPKREGRVRSIAFFFIFYLKINKLTAPVN